MQERYQHLVNWSIVGKGKPEWPIYLDEFIDKLEARMPRPTIVCNHLTIILRPHHPHPSAPHAQNPPQTEQPSDVSSCATPRGALAAIDARQRLEAHSLIALVQVEEEAEEEEAEDGVPQAEPDEVPQAEPDEVPQDPEDVSNTSTAKVVSRVLTKDRVENQQAKKMQKMNRVRVRISPSPLTGLTLTHALCRNSKFRVAL